jgi:hypothetical protein
MTEERLALPAQSYIIGADDGLRPYGLQTTCEEARSTRKGKAAMRKASTATSIDSIGDKVTGRIAGICTAYIVAWPGMDRNEKDSERLAQ